MKREGRVMLRKLNNHFRYNDYCLKLYRLNLKLALIYLYHRIIRNANGAFDFIFLTKRCNNHILITLNMSITNRRCILWKVTAFLEYAKIQSNQHFYCHNIVITRFTSHKLFHSLVSMTNTILSVERRRRLYLRNQL